MMEFEQLRLLVERCTSTETSPFYRELYRLSPQDSAMHISSYDEWLALPFFSKEEVMATTLPARIFPPWNNIDAILASSGTSGSIPVFNPWSLTENYAFRLRFHEFRKATLTSTPTPQQQRHIMERFGGHSVVLDPRHPKATMLLSDAAGVDSMVIFVHHLRLIGEEMKRLGRRDQIRYVELTGEPCSRETYSYAKETFPNAVITSIYGSTDVETSPMGVPCRPITGEEPLEVFHPNEKTYLEIADLENGRILPIKKGTEGDLVITTDSGENGVFPLIRYKIGDTVRVVEETCGEHGEWSFEVLGRTEMDFVKLPGGVLRADEVERVLHVLEKNLMSDVFELHRYERETPHGPLLEFVLHLEARTGVDLAVLAGDIAKLVRVAPDFTYAQGVAEGRYLPLRCEHLQRNATLAKHKRVIRH